MMKNKTPIIKNALRLAALGALLCASFPSYAVDPYQTGLNGRFSDEIQDNYIDDGFKGMTKELTHVIMSHAAIIGGFFDSKQQLEKQQTYQKLVAEAHKDYRPSDAMCRYGTYMRSIASSDAKASANEVLLSQVFSNMYTAEKWAATGESRDQTELSRVRRYVASYCDPSDNGGGLDQLCINSASVKSKNMNKDISYARILGDPLTLDVDYIEDNDGYTEREKAIYSLGRNLYMAFATQVQDDETINNQLEAYMQQRSLQATLSVAHSSFMHLVGQKSRAPEFTSSEKPGWNFMKSMMREFNIPDDDIHMLLGDYPSYHAQMEVLTKKIYQNPEFYTSLYDTPTNVKRVNASMEAIKLMQGRDAYEASLREEMLYSTLVEQQIRKKIDKLGNRLGKI